MNKPNLFIVGSPKCGTTSLVNYLTSHNDIFFSIPKEPHFFGSDLKGLSNFISLKHYLLSFETKKNAKWFGDASVWSGLSVDALQEISQYSGNAKIIYMYRSPAEMVQSLHMQKLFSGDEDLVNLSDAWNASFEREKGRMLPKNCRCNITVQYHKAADHLSIYNKIISLFPKENILFVDFNELAQDPLSVYLKVLHFLSLDYDNKTNFPVYNKRKKSRSRVLSSILHYRPPTSVKLYSAKIKSFLGIRTWGVTRFLFSALIKINRKEADPGEADQSTMIDIKDYFDNSYAEFLSKVKD